MRALLIENSRLYHLFLADLFRRLDYQPVMVESGEAALSHLEREDFDLVCMNLVFEGSCGIEFAAELRARAGDAPILLLTSSGDEAVRQQALQLGVTEVIYKSDLDATRSAISTFVKHHAVSSITGSRILYVEDSRTEALQVTRMLTSMGLQVSHHRTAEAALEQFLREAFDLVITDVVLLGQVSGLGLLRAIRDLGPRKAQTPVLTITGFDDRSRRIELFRSGTNDYIAKPVVQEELAARVCNLISHKRLIDQAVKQQAQMYRLATTDGLTGCLNRFGLAEYAQRRLTSASRRGESLSLLVVDLDHFKQINDRHGHGTGDQVLREVGALLREQVRSDDRVVRFGGEEFVILLPDCTKWRAKHRAELIRKRIRELQPAGLEISASIGVTHSPEPAALTFDDLFWTADKAVYRAKQRGRDCVSFLSTKNRGTSAGEPFNGTWASMAAASAQLDQDAQ